MTKKNRILCSAMLIAGLSLPIPAATAAGLLNQRYVSATYEWVDFDEPNLRNGRGIGVAYNQPLTDNVDLGLGIGEIRSRFAGQRIRGTAIDFNTTYIMTLDDFKPYGRAGVAWTRTRSGGFSQRDWLYALEIGAEFAAGDRVAISPFITFVDGFRSRVSSSWDFGVRGDVDITDQIGALVSVARSNDGDWGLSLGGIFRF